MLERSIAIIIVNWNSFDDTAECLKSLKKLTYSNYSIIVVDNGSADGSGIRLKEEFPHITLLSNKTNLGFTGGNNRGLEYAISNDYELLMLLNNDTIVTPNFIEPLVLALDKEEVGAVQPKIFFNKERDIIWNAGSFFNRFLFFPKTKGTGNKDNETYSKETQLPWITGCCFLVKTEIIKEIGLLDDNFFIYYEDTDWSFRIKELGYNLIFVPSSHIYHEVGSSHKKRSSEGEGNLSPFAHYVTVRNHIFLLRKHHDYWNLPSGFIYQAIKLCSYILYFTLRNRPKKRKASLNGFLDGIKTKLVEKL